MEIELKVKMVEPVEAQKQSLSVEIDFCFSLWYCSDLGSQCRSREFCPFWPQKRIQGNPTGEDERRIRLAARNSGRETPGSSSMVERVHSLY